MSFFYLFLIGILIGTAMIVPGVSGAVIAVIFGVYDKLISALTNLFKDFKNNFVFLFVLGLGIIIGAVWFSNILMFLFERQEFITKCCFVGLILGGVPCLFKVVKNKGDRINYIALFITLIFSFLLWIISEKYLSINLSETSSSIVKDFLKLFLSGVIYSVGKVIPGISSSFLLVVIGMYEFVLSVIAHPISFGLMNIKRVIPFAIGLISGAIVLLKVMSHLLKKHFGLIYSIIIGFVIGSIPALIPIFLNIKQLMQGIFFAVLSFYLSYKMTK